MIEVEAEDLRNGFCRRHLKITNTKVSNKWSLEHCVVSGADRKSQSLGFQLDRCVCVVSENAYTQCANFSPTCQPIVDLEV